MRALAHMCLVLGVALLASAGSWTSVQTAKADSPLGLRLPAKARLLQDGRYKLAQSYSKAIVFFKRQLKRGKVKHSARERVRRAGVKFTHFRSLDSTTLWAHVNVSTYDGGVFVRILGR